MKGLETYENLNLFELPPVDKTYKPKREDENFEILNEENQENKYIQETLELFPKIKTLKAKKRT